MAKFNNKNNNNKRTAEEIGCIEYKMPEALAKEYLKNRSGDEKKMRPNEYLCTYHVYFYKLTF